MFQLKKYVKKISLNYPILKLHFPKIKMALGAFQTCPKQGGNGPSFLITPPPPNPGPLVPIMQFHEINMAAMRKCIVLFLQIKRVGGNYAHLQLLLAP